MINFPFFQIRFGDFKILPKLIPALKTLFADVLDEMEERRERRELRNPRGGGFEVADELKIKAAAGGPADGRGAKREQTEEVAAQNLETKRLKSS